MITLRDGVVLPVPVEIPGGGDLEAVISLIEGAGILLLEHNSAELDFEKKGFRDLVTRADHASESHILAGLENLFPDDSVYAEESGDVYSRGDRCWIIDPLDGTTNFFHKHPFYCVSAGLVVGNETVAAVTHAPELQKTWWAILSGGCWCRDLKTKKQSRVRVKPAKDLAEALLATGFSYQRKELGHGGLEAFGNLLGKAREIRRGGSACLDLAHTASGIFQGFWEFYLAPHDVAAGALLVTEAGGIVSDSTGGDDWLRSGSIVAGTPDIHPLLLSEVCSASPPDLIEGQEGPR